MADSTPPSKSSTPVTSTSSSESVSILRLRDATRLLATAEAEAVNILSESVAELRRHRQKWADERAAIASGFIERAVPSLFQDHPVINDDGELHQEVVTQLHHLGAALLLGNADAASSTIHADALSQRTMQAIKRHKKMASFLSAMPDLNLIEKAAALTTLGQRLRDDLAVLRKMNMEAENPSSPLGALRYHVPFCFWLNDFTRNIRRMASDVAPSHTKGLEEQTKIHTQKALRELAAWAQPKPWWVRVLRNVGFEKDFVDGALIVKITERETGKSMAALLHEAAAQLVLKTQQEVRAEASRKAESAARREISKIEKAINLLCWTQGDLGPISWADEASRPTRDWTQELFREVLDQCLQQKTLPQGVRRAGAADLAQIMELTEAKLNIVDRVLEATEGELLRRQGAAVQTSRQVESIENAYRKSPLQRVRVNIEQIEAAGPQMLTEARGWREKAHRVTTLADTGSNATTTRAQDTGHAGNTGDIGTEDLLPLMLLQQLLVDVEAENTIARDHEVPFSMPQAAAGWSFEADPQPWFSPTSHVLSIISLDGVGDCGGSSCDSSDGGCGDGGGGGD